MSDDFIVQLNVCDERFSPLSDTAVCSTVLAFLGSFFCLQFLDVLVCHFIVSGASPVTMNFLKLILEAFCPNLTESPRS